MIIIVAVNICCHNIFFLLQMQLLPELDHIMANQINPFI